MPTYVLLTRIMPETIKDPQDLRRLEKTVSERIRNECPSVRWIANYAVLGPYDYLDIFEAPDETEAARVVLIIRSFGHAVTETWSALPWERFERILPT
jgi:uncharacterized protein with GYD domain